MWRAVVPAVIVVGLLVVGCGGSSGGDATVRATAGNATATMRATGGGATATVAATGSATSTVAAPATSAARLPTTAVTIGGRTIAVEVAATEAAREHGLSDRDALPADAGMLFDLGQTTIATFWMKDMRFPLDMVWITDDRTVAGVASDAQPQPGAADSDLTLYRSPAPVRYVLELNAGAAARLGFSDGARVSLGLPAVNTTPDAR